VSIISAALTALGTTSCMGYGPIASLSFWNISEPDVTFIPSSHLYLKIIS